MKRTRGARLRVEELLNGRCGSRFTDYYERRRRERAGKLSASLSVLGGTLLIALGLVLGLTPGPGFIFVLAGAAILAARSRLLARALDRCEIYLLRVLGRGKSRRG